MIRRYIVTLLLCCFAAAMSKGSRSVENLWVTTTAAGGSVEVTCTDWSHWVHDSVYSVERDDRQYVIRSPGVTVFLERGQVQRIVLPNKRVLPFEPVKLGRETFK